MKLTLDVENTVTERDGKLHFDPFEPENSLTMVGVLTDQGVERHFPFDHSDVPNQKDYYERVHMMGLCLIPCSLSMYYNVVSRNLCRLKPVQSVTSWTQRNRIH